MLSIQETDLIKEQIEKSYWEIIMQNIVFVLINSLSLFVIGFIFYKVFFDFDNKTSEYDKIFQAGATLFVPYLTFVAQGFSYPRRRKIITLRYFLFKDSLSSDDLKSLYDK